MKNKKSIIGKIASATAAVLSIASPLQVPAIQTQQTHEINAKQTNKNSVITPVTIIQPYTIPRRFTEGSKQGKRHKWARGEMSRFKQQLQHKKYATKK